MQHRTESEAAPEAGAAIVPGLGDFLRSRRERLNAEACGFRSRSRQRRTPGLRREEVAELAGISSAWYANLEARKVQPSTGTLLAIAMALRLSDPETDYLFELAGFAAPLRMRDPEVKVTPALRAIVASSPHAATLFDCYFTPLLWNCVAGAMFDYDATASDFDRNLIVRGLTDERLVRLFGDDFEMVAMRTVGMFRRVLATHRPTALAQRIYEFGTLHELFRRGWREEAIVEGVTPPRPFARHHDIVGTFRVESTDLRVGTSNDAILRILTPADAESSATFDRLRDLG
jgi:transcriptional regulator with XRE-family HTH domain